MFPGYINLKHLMWGLLRLSSTGKYSGRIDWQNTAYLSLTISEKPFKIRRRTKGYAITEYLSHSCLQSLSQIKYFHTAQHVMPSGKPLLYQFVTAYGQCYAYFITLYKTHKEHSVQSAIEIFMFNVRKCPLYVPELPLNKVRKTKKK